ncbi:glycoside hydrolase family 38 C-terminal domain-containing protein [Lacticaseibacillus jixianensis]|uniref:Glycoside hydrolase family 38 C-terminal domain-containing protein n=1 Tax=Lacticaseibacillus jixianensis TaxID=2486012 RepID=A0ABW4BDG8_9LACO|nr:glycoside hydrolase family 38 C-terminal domain-containing protein [Lacticaseibacillus jixianensis]
MTKTIVHIVPHTHWDREWYFQNTRATVYLISQINEVVEVLEDHPNTYFYLFDAQSSLIEDYLSYYPENRAKLSHLIKSHRFLTGPWYTQTDQIAVGQESIIRNLYYGIDYAEKLGHSMRIGYCPDVFGQGGNMPQIYKSFDIDHAIIWRGVGNSKLQTTEFQWTGVDGTAIQTTQMPFGYFYGANIPTEDDDLRQFIASMIPKLEQRSLISDIYLPNGFDQLPINRHLDGIIAKLNRLDPTRKYVISSPEEYMKAVTRDLHDEAVDLPELSGELTDGENSRVHKSIYSTRADLKKLNNELEAYVTNILEPLAVIGKQLGLRYPQAEIEKIWKQLLRNAAHDSIGNCNSDSTNFDIKARNKWASDLAHNLAEKIMRDISSNIKQDKPYALTVFNSLPYKRSSTVETNIYIPDGKFTIEDEKGTTIPFQILTEKDESDYVLHQAELLTPTMYRSGEKNPWMPKKVYLAHLKLFISDVPALGYRELYLRPSESGEDTPVSGWEAGDSISNGLYTIHLDQSDNTFTVTSKNSGKTFAHQFRIIENGDEGDSYNFSPAVTDMVITSGDAKLVTVTKQAGLISESLKVDLLFSVPRDLETRSVGKAEVAMPVTIIVTLNKDDPIVHVSTVTNNPVSSHRLRIQCDTGIKANCSVADSLFGTVKHPLVDPNLADWRERGWVEKPTEINALQSFAALSDSRTTVAGFTSGAREYEITGEDYTQLNLTMFRSNSWMGRENLQNRPGRASGETIVATPDAELLGKQSYEFGFYYGNQPFDDCPVGELSKELYSPLQVYELAPFLNSRIRFIRNLPSDKKLPEKYSVVDLGRQQAVFSAIKKSELNQTIVFRAFNPFVERPVSVSLPERAVQTKSDEFSIVSPASVDLGPDEFATYLADVGGEVNAHIKEAY